MDQPSPRLDPKTHFRELYEREYLAVFRTIRAMVLDSAAAEDLTQEAFVRAYRARDRYKPTAPAGAWLHRIAVNVAISHLRRQKLSRIIAPRLLLDPDSGGYEQAEARTVVERLLERLSPKLRAAVVLHFYHGYTRDEIAAALGIPAGTVASRMAKAMTMMRAGLDMSDQMPAPARSSR